MNFKEENKMAENDNVRTQIIKGIGTNLNEAQADLKSRIESLEKTFGKKTIEGLKPETRFGVGFYIGKKSKDLDLVTAESYKDAFLGAEKLFDISPTRGVRMYVEVEQTYLIPVAEEKKAKVLGRGSPAGGFSPRSKGIYGSGFNKY
jgi:hypothetical protein